MMVNYGQRQQLGAFTDSGIAERVKEGALHIGRSDGVAVTTVVVDAIDPVLLAIIDALGRVKETTDAGIFESSDWNSPHQLSTLFDGQKSTVYSPARERLLAHIDD